MSTGKMKKKMKEKRNNEKMGKNKCQLRNKQKRMKNKSKKIANGCQRKKEESLEKLAT